jgi:hypothetical protein
LARSKNRAYDPVPSLRKTMPKHKFRITVESVAEADENPVHAPLVFTVENHDDIIALVERAGANDDHARAFLVGLKLFGETMLQDRDNPLYAEIQPAFGAFMKKLKAARRNANPGAEGAG